MPGPDGELKLTEHGHVKHPMDRRLYDTGGSVHYEMVDGFMTTSFIEPAPLDSCPTCGSTLFRSHPKDFAVLHTTTEEPWCAPTARVPPLNPGDRHLLELVDVELGAKCEISVQRMDTSPVIIVQPIEPGRSGQFVSEVAPALGFVFHMDGPPDRPPRKAPQAQALALLREVIDRCPMIPNDLGDRITALTGQS